LVLEINWGDNHLRLMAHEYLDKKNLYKGNGCLTYSINIHLVNYLWCIKYLIYQWRKFKNKILKEMLEIQISAIIL